MPRRSFLQKSGVLLSATMLPLSTFAIKPAHKYKMGLQLFTIRDAMAKDAVGTLKKVKALGYEDLEIYGYDENNGSYYGFKSARFKEILDDLGLTTTSGHYGFHPFLLKSASELERYVDQCIEGALALEQSYITWPWLDPENRTIEKFKLLSGKLNTIGEQVNKAGLGFAYHNHDFEFIDHNGQNGYDIILEETDPDLVKLQLDLYWAVHSYPGKPIDLIKRQPGRFVMWHIKDMDKVTRDYTELGNGSIDYTKIIPYAEPLSGLEYYYLEQGGNFAVNSMQSITDSAAFFKKHLQKYL
ncbi:sugar phosphate isomerase/epimerase [Muriicola sp. Z0-33]|nr:sugar phosphate isomerase/epimerase [Muriicola sp. Z0-33]